MRRKNAGVQYLRCTAATSNQPTATPMEAMDPCCISDTANLISRSKTINFIRKHALSPEVCLDSLSGFEEYIGN